MMEEILIPMECLYDIPSLNHMAMPSYKKGDIFMYNPYHEVHVELEEHGVFKEVENNLCKFICQYQGLLINKKQYDVGEEISDEDIKLFSDTAIKDLCVVGYIQKVLKKEKVSKQQKVTQTKGTKKQTAKKSTSETYATLGRKLGYKSPDFKKEIFNALGIEVKDMRKKVPAKVKKKITEAFGK